MVVVLTLLIAAAEPPRLLDRQLELHPTVVAPAASHRCPNILPSTRVLAKCMVHAEAPAPAIAPPAPAARHFADVMRGAAVSTCVYNADVKRSDPRFNRRDITVQAPIFGDSPVRLLLRTNISRDLNIVDYHTGHAELYAGFAY